MDGLGRALGCPWTAKIGGKTYLAEPLTLWRIGVIENHLLSQRELPHEKIRTLAAACFDAPTVLEGFQKKADQEMKLRETRIVTIEQLNEYLDSDSGVCFSGWLCLAHYPEFRCLEDFTKSFMALSAVEKANLVKGRNIASGMGILASFDWPSEKDFVRPERRGRRMEKYHNWRLLFRSMVEGAMVSKATYRNFTLYELRAMACDENELKDLREVSALEASKMKTAKPTFIIGPDGKGLAEYKRFLEERRGQGKSKSGGSRDAT